MMQLPQKRILALACLLLGACAGTGTSTVAATPRPESVWLLTAGGKLLAVNAGVPGVVEKSVSVSGLAAGEKLIGIDMRSANGKLYGLSGDGLLYTIDPASGASTRVGSGKVSMPAGSDYGFDFNPVVDRIRLVSDAGENRRVHPDTGNQVDADPAKEGLQGDGDLVYADGDAAAGQKGKIAGAAYTYSKVSKTGTTNFAIDAARSALVTQGSREGATPAVSPNTGKLFTVGELGVKLEGKVGFDISWKDNTAFASFKRAGASQSELWLIDLASGRASSLGKVAGSDEIVGMAVANEI